MGFFYIYVTNILFLMTGCLSYGQLQEKDLKGFIEALPQELAGEIYSMKINELRKDLKFIPLDQKDPELGGFFLKPSMPLKKNRVKNGLCLHLPSNGLATRYLSDLLIDETDDEKIFFQETCPYEFQRSDENLTVAFDSGQKINEFQFPYNCHSQESVAYIKGSSLYFLKIDFKTQQQLNATKITELNNLSVNNVQFGPPGIFIADEKGPPSQEGSFFVKQDRCYSQEELYETIIQQKKKRSIWIIDTNKAEPEITTLQVVGNINRPALSRFVNNRRYAFDSFYIYDMITKSAYLNKEFSRIDRQIESIPFLYRKMNDHHKPALYFHGFQNTHAIVELIDNARQFVQVKKLSYEKYKAINALDEENAKEIMTKLKEMPQRLKYEILYFTSLIKLKEPVYLEPTKPIWKKYRLKEYATPFELIDRSIKFTVFYTEFVKKFRNKFMGYPKCIFHAVDLIHVV